MEDIILNGVSINELKKQKSLIQKDAAKFIADAQEKVEALAKSLKEAVEVEGEDQDIDLINSICKEAIEVLQNIDLVSGISGVQYYLEYNDYNGYHDPDGPVITSLLEDNGIESDISNKLYFLAEGMEAEVRDWNTSTC